MFFHQPEVILRLKHNLETFERIRMRFPCKNIETRKKLLQMVFLRWKRLFSSKIHSIKNSRPTICIYWVSRFIFWCFRKMNLNVFVRFRSQINNLENSDVFRFDFQIEFQKFSKFDTVEHMKSEYHVTYIRKNWNFWSKNKYFSMKSRFLIDKWRFLSRKYQFFIQKMRYFYCPSFHSRCRFICSVFISM